MGGSDSSKTSKVDPGDHACFAILSLQDDYAAGRIDGNDAVVARFHSIAAAAQASDDPYIRTSMRRMDEAAIGGTQSDLEAAFAAVRSACDLPG